MTKSKKILILALYLGLTLIFLICVKFHVPCLIKKYFHISCPGCGITRAFLCIFQFKFIESFSYNILAFPLFCFLSIALLLDINDLLFNKNYLTSMINKLSKSYYVILLLVIVSFIINNYRGI